MGKQNCAGDSHLWVQLLHRFWQLSKLSSEWILLDSVCTMATALNVSNSNELQNPFKKYFTFIVFFCHRLEGKERNWNFEIAQKYLQDFPTKKTDLLSSHWEGKNFTNVKFTLWMQGKAPIPSILKCDTSACLFVCSGTCEVIEQKVQQCE